MPCETLEELRENAACGSQNLKLQQLIWADIQMLCKYRDWYAAGGESNPDFACDLDELVAEGRCVNASVLELAYFRSQLLCSLVNTITQGGGSGGVCTPFMLRKFGSGSPEGVVVGCKGDRYVDVDTGTSYVYIGVNGDMTGWL